MAHSFVYFDVAHAVAVHDWIIEHSGGRAGNNNIGLLRGPLEHIKNDGYYPSFEDKLTHLVFSVNKQHAFVDGNKRSSIALGAYFLELNGYGFMEKHFIKEMENVAVWIADNLINKSLLLEVITSIINDEEYSEELKLKIANAICVEG